MQSWGRIYKMVYNTTFMDTSNNIFEFVSGLNTSSNSQIVYWILVLVWVITFISMKNFDTKVIFFSSSFLTTIIAILFFSIGWITMTILIIPIVMTFFSLLAFWLNKE